MAQKDTVDVYFAVKKAPLGKFGYSIMKPKTKKRINKEKHEERVEKNRTKHYNYECMEYCFICMDYYFIF